MTEPTTFFSDVFVEATEQQMNELTTLFSDVLVEVTEQQVIEQQTQPNKKLKVRRTSSSSSVITDATKAVRGRGRGRCSGRGRGRTTSSNGSNRTLVDEDVSEFEALLSQANSGVPMVPSTQGPTPWDQLNGIQANAAPTQLDVPPTTRMGYKPMFTTQSREEALGKQLFKEG